MPNYSKSIIYKLECRDPKVTEIYVGATTDFFRRKSEHKMRCINKDGNFELNEPKYCFMRLNGGWDNWQMLQIIEVNARNKRHLNQIEAKYIRDLKAELNYKIPQDIEEGLDMKEWNKEYRAKNSEKIKEYYAKNSEKITKRKKEYNAKNSEKITKREKEYNAKNSEKIKEWGKEYYAKISEKNKVKVKCPCGSEVNKSILLKHKRSQKHKDWENLPEPNLIFVD